MPKKTLSLILLTFAAFLGLLVFIRMRPMEAPQPGPSAGTPTVAPADSARGSGITPSLTATKTACSREFTPKFNAGPYYNGLLFDTHFHWPITFEKRKGNYRFPVIGKDVAEDEIFCLMAKERYAGAIVSYFPDFSQIEKALEDAARLKKKFPIAGLKWFLAPGSLGAPELENILSRDPKLFDGLGEIVLYDPERIGAAPDDKVSMEIYKVAEKYGLVMLLHPGLNQKSRIENALKSNPNVKFLLHGSQSENYILELIGKYSNVFYSVDSATLYPFNIMYVSGPKEKFVSLFGQNFNSILNAGVSEWKDRIKKYPDRFVWGVDRFTDWHYGEEISILTEEFGRAFIGKLDTELQEKFAYKNAENLLQKNILPQRQD